MGGEDRASASLEDGQDDSWRTSQRQVRSITAAVSYLLSIMTVWYAPSSHPIPSLPILTTMDTLIDALPYVDKEIEQLPGMSASPRVECTPADSHRHAGLKDAVLKEIQREMKTTPKVAADDARLPPQADIFSARPSLVSHRHMD